MCEFCLKHKYTFQSHELISGMNKNEAGIFGQRAKKQKQIENVKVCFGSDAHLDSGLVFLLVLVSKPQDDVWVVHFFGMKKRQSPHFRKHVPHLSAQWTLLSGTQGMTPTQPDTERQTYF